MSEVKQGRATQEAVTALTQYLIESGAENYIEDHYTITLDGSAPTTAVITVQYTDKPSAHELRVQAESERDQLAADNKRLMEALEKLARDETYAGDVARSALSTTANGEVAG